MVTKQSGINFTEKSFEAVQENYRRVVKISSSINFINNENLFSGMVDYESFKV